MRTGLASRRRNCSRALIDGYWVRRGWDREAPVQTVAPIDTRRTTRALPRLDWRLLAWPFAGNRGISGVEASLDGGTTWSEARTKPRLGSSTWVQWAADWKDVAPGRYSVLARATDGTGALQAPDEHDSLPSGATGYHRASIEVVQ